MKTLLKTLILLFIVQAHSYSCGCGHRSKPIKNDIQESEAIFIGVVLEIKEKEVFYLTNQIGSGMKYINFEVIQSNKGFNKSIRKMSVFDNSANTSCEGLLTGKEVGDTILMFAKEFLPSMLGSYLCGRHPNMNELTDEENHFVDTATWYNPQSYHFVPESNAVQQINSAAATETHVEIQEKNALFLILSLALNAILILTLLLKHRSKSS